MAKGFGRPGMGGMGGGINMNMIKQAQKMQENMQKMQAEMESKEYTAQAGGGVVSATVTGRHEVVALTIDPEAVDPEDVELLQDMIVAVETRPCGPRRPTWPRGCSSSPAGWDCPSKRKSAYGIQGGPGARPVPPVCPRRAGGREHTMILETKRLRLRELTEGGPARAVRDSAGRAAMYAYEHAFSDREVDQWLARQMDRYRREGFGLWAVIRREDGAFVGQCGLTPAGLGRQEGARDRLSSAAPLLAQRLRCRGRRGL